MMLRTVSAAYAETGRFGEAIAVIRQAIQLASVRSNSALVNGFEAQLKLYEAGLPVRDSGQTMAPAAAGPRASDH